MPTKGAGYGLVSRHWIYGTAAVSKWYLRPGSQDSDVCRMHTDVQGLSGWSGREYDASRKDVHTCMKGCYAGHRLSRADVRWPVPAGLRSLYQAARRGPNARNAFSSYTVWLWIFALQPCQCALAVEPQACPRFEIEACACKTWNAKSAVSNSWLRSELLVEYRFIVALGAAWDVRLTRSRMVQTSWWRENWLLTIRELCFPD